MTNYRNPKRTLAVLNLIISIAVMAGLFYGGGLRVEAQASLPAPSTAAGAPSGAQALPGMPNDEIGSGAGMGQMRTTTQAMRNAAAFNQNQKQKAVTATYAGINPATASYSPLGVVSSAINTLSNGIATMAAAVTDYFGIANWTNSPLPTINPTTGAVSGGMRKFVDTLPGLTAAGKNDLNQYIPLATPDILTFPGAIAVNPLVKPADYYEIGLVEYYEQMHKDLPGLYNIVPGLISDGTKLRGYVQLYPLGTLAAAVPTAVPLTMANGVTSDIIDPITLAPRLAYDKPNYLGPMILAQKDRPVRIKFTNLLPTGPAGNLFIPVDHTYMGAGMGPNQSIKEIAVTASGAGYTSAPVVSFNNTGTGGTGAAATANLLSGKVVSITVTNGGSGYTSAPAVILTGGGFTTAATASATITSPNMMENYTENRATLHLHGGNTPWISDGTPHQWTTPAGEITSYSKGESAAYVPDMWFDASGNLIASCAEALTCAVAGATNDPGAGSLTFYYTNQESGRLLFYHDHAYGITRLNVYAGEAAGYLITDPTEEAALLAASLPGTISKPANLADPANDLAHLVPLVIQDKTYLPDNGAAGGALAATDPTWDLTKYGNKKGQLWLPHVWMPNQNPADISGANAYGRWDYGPWFWPAQNPATFVPSGQPYACNSVFYSGTSGPAYPPLMCPGIPNPTGVMEAMMDTPVVNGTAYPSLTVDPTAYRFQVLNAGNDRALNLGLYKADPLNVALTSGGSGYLVAPTVTFVGNATDPINAAATTTISSGNVTAINLTNVGKGYITPPAVTIVDTGLGLNASATASVDPITGTIAAIKINNQGTGYASAATITVTIAAPSTCVVNGTTCVQATGVAVVTPAGVVTSITVTNPGTGTWTSNPTVVFTGAATTPATAIASTNTEVKMVPAVPATPTSLLPGCSVANDVSGAMMVLGLLDATGNPLNGTGLPAGCYPSGWPTDGRDGGVPDPTMAGPAIVQIGNESGVLPAPVLIPSTPVGYEYNRKSITVLNIFTHGLLIGPAERADLVVDFSKYAGQTLILYNDGPAPVPAFDPRNDYYTGDADNTMSGGAPSTLPGYGPNTRTIMQIKVNAVAAVPPKVTFSYPALTAALPNIFAVSQKQIIVPEPVYPAANGGSPIATYSRIQDTSLTGWFGIPLGGLTLTNPGLGYAVQPNVSITGGGGSGATATVNFVGGYVNNLTLVGGGTGYNGAPTVTLSAPGVGTNTATATAQFNGVVSGVTVTNGGSGYTKMPAVSLSGGGGTGATATAVGSVNAITVTNGGSGYLTAPLVTLSAPTGAGPVQATATAVLSTTGTVASITITNPGAGYLTAPTVTFNNTGTGGGGARASTNLNVLSVTVTAPGANYTTWPTVVFTNSGTGGGTGAAGTAVLSGSVTSLILTNAGAGYTANPTVSFSATSGTAASALATILPGTITGLTITNPGTGFTSTPTVTIDPPPAGGTQATAAATPPVTLFRPKAIQELFTLDYGRMNATLGVELAFTNFANQTTIPYGYIDPPTELYRSGEMQIWKITHNGVDTHFIHFHLFDVQVINRVGWDGMIKPPDANEIGWKDTVRMNPLEDIIVALRPMKQVLPWPLPNSVRPLDVTMPIGASNAANTPGFANIDPANNPVTVTNDMTNFGWEYVWHCHILEHEEIDMMRPTSLAVAPADPSLVTTTLVGTGNGQRIIVGWQDNSINESGFTVQRATSLLGPWISFATPPVAGSGSLVSFTDTTVARRTPYYYRVIANNRVGYVTPTGRFPTLSADSNAVAPAAAPITTLGASSLPAPIFTDSFETGLNQWSAREGEVQALASAVAGPNGGKLGLAAKLSANPAYVAERTPTLEAAYTANFYFDPNGAITGAPVDIFLGLDQNGQPAFGVQYQGLSATSFQLRGWVLQNGSRVTTNWKQFVFDANEDVVKAAHKIDVSWQSGANARFTFYIDDAPYSTPAGNTSATKISAAVLGPTFGVSAAASGTMYFDEFTSSQINGVQTFFYYHLPLIGN